MNNRISFNDNLILELDNKIQNSLKEKENLQHHHSEIEKLERIKYDEMNKTYRQLSNKVSEFKWKETAIETEFTNKRMNMIDKEKEKENLEM